MSSGPSVCLLKLVSRPAIDREELLGLMLESTYVRRLWVQDGSILLPPTRLVMVCGNLLYARHLRYVMLHRLMLNRTGLRSR